MMAKIEEILENWKWYEEDITKYLEKFEKYLNSKEGESELEKRSKKLSMIQESLKDEKSIESLTSEKLIDLLNKLDASKGNRNPILSIKKGNEEYFKEVKTWLKNLIKIYPRRSSSVNC